MVIGIFGESCTGKSTLAELLRQRTDAQVFSGKDYLRLAKNEAIARRMFEKLLQDAVTGGHVIYVISEKEHLPLLPDGAVRVKVTADLDVIFKRFAQRMHGTLPPPVRTMLEKKHGMFNAEKCDVHVTGDMDREAAVEAVLANM